MASKACETSVLTKARCSAVGITFCQGTGTSPNEPVSWDIAWTKRFGGEVSTLLPPNRRAVSRHQSLSFLQRPSNHQVSLGTTLDHSNVPSSTTRCLSVPSSRLSMQRRGTNRSYGSLACLCRDHGLELRGELCDADRVLPNTPSISVSELPHCLEFARREGMCHPRAGVHVVERGPRLEVDEVPLAVLRQWVSQRRQVQHRRDDTQGQTEVARAVRVGLVVGRERRQDV